MFKREFLYHTIDNSKRRRSMKEFFLSPSLHHIRRRKGMCEHKQEASNQNQSISLVHRKLKSKSACSSSYYSRQNYLKKLNLSERDLLELRQALRTIVDYTRSEMRFANENQRLTSPYLNYDDELSRPPLYTNEYFIRNGLLNHNDGPEVHDENFCYPSHSKPVVHLRHFSQPSYCSWSCLTTTSLENNNSSPLAMLSPNQQHVFTALTGNFISVQSRRTQSDMEMSMNQDLNENETESIVIRRNKVQAWERKNMNKQEKRIKNFCKPSQSNVSQSYYSSTDVVSLKTIDNLFPMIKTLAPYIVIRPILPAMSVTNPNVSSCRTANVRDSTNSIHDGRSVLSANHLTSPSAGKRPLIDLPVSPLTPLKRRQTVKDIFQNVSNNCQQKSEQQRRQKSYLLAEFESILTSISGNNHCR